MKDLFTSRKFWTTVFALIVLVVGSLIKGFELDGEVAAGFAVIVVSYLIGVAVDPGPGGWRGVLLSRKFWAAAVGLILMILEAFQVKLPFLITGDQLVEIALVIGAYIAGVALEPKKLTEHDIQSYG